MVKHHLANHFAGEFAGAFFALLLHVRRQGQHHPAGQVNAVIALQQEGHAAFARLAVDANHRLIIAADIVRVNGQISHLPRLIGLLVFERLTNGILMAA